MPVPSLTIAALTFEALPVIIHASPCSSSACNGNPDICSHKCLICITPHAVPCCSLLQWLW